MLDIEMKWSVETIPSIVLRSLRHCRTSDLFDTPFLLGCYGSRQQLLCVCVFVWWMMLWLKDRMVKQHQSLYFLLLFFVAVTGVTILHNFSLLSKLWQLIFLWMYIFSFFCFCLLLATTAQFAISNEPIATSRVDSWLYKFSLLRLTLYLSSRDWEYELLIIPLLRFDVKSSEWTLIDCDTFFINIIIFDGVSVACVCVCVCGDVD